MKNDTRGSKSRRSAPAAAPATVGPGIDASLEPAATPPEVTAEPGPLEVQSEVAAGDTDAPVGMPVDEPTAASPNEALTILAESDQPAAEVEVPGAAGPPPSLIGRRGQIQAAKARFDLGPQQRILGEALGELPPGYGLTHCSAWVRDPRHLIAIWDINSPEQTERGQELGWERLVLRLLDRGGDVLRQIPVSRRSGIWHVAVPRAGIAVRIAVGFLFGDGRFDTVARSHFVALPTGEPSSDLVEERARLPSQLDRRRLLRAEPPPRPGFGDGGQESPAWRLHKRINMSRRVTPPEAWFGPFRSAWDAGTAPPPRVVIDSQPERPDDEDERTSSPPMNSAPQQIPLQQQAPAHPETRVQSTAESANIEVDDDWGRQAVPPQRPHRALPTRPYEDRPSPPAHSKRTEPASPPRATPSATPGAALERSATAETHRTPTVEPMSSPRGGYGKPRPERP